MHSFSANGVSPIYGPYETTAVFVDTVGTFGGGTLTVEMIRAGDAEGTATNWVAVPGAALTAPGLITFTPFSGYRWRFRLAGATSPNVTVREMQPAGSLDPLRPLLGLALRPASGGGGGGGAVTISGTVTTNEPLAHATREYGTLTRQAVGGTSARVALPTLNATREVYVLPSARCFILTGDNTVVAAAGAGHPVPADDRFHLRVPAGHTHIAYIRDSADGHITVCAVA